jgi:hypothetical protein
MIALVTKADLDGYKYIADSIKNYTSWIQFVSEAQLFDIKSWLTDALLLEIIGQASTLPTTFSVANQTLLNGGSYVYNSHTYYFQGLKACIIYYAFARFTNRTSFNYTAAGIVVKDSDLSTPASSKDIQRLETEARLQADAIKCEVITYLDRNSTLYPLWAGKACGCSGACSDSRPFVVLGD